MSDQTLPNENQNGQPTSPPTTFSDAAGNVWSIKLTLGLIDEVQEATQVDLVPDDCNLGPLASKALSAKEWSTLLWLCIRKQAEARGITQKDFVSELDADTLAQSAEALGEAIRFFIQRTKGKEMAEATIGTYHKSMDLMNQAAQAILENMESPKSKQVFKDFVTEAIKGQQAEMKRGLEKLSKDALAGSAIS